jgi:peptidoglycan/LPS O-acetylase OafA/YrhL
MNNNDRIEHIDVWRFLAIALVIFSHIIKFSHPWYKETLPSLVWRAEPLRALGVKLFFCISGFVICRGMLKENIKNGTVNMRAFYVRRACRIFPRCWCTSPF